MSPLKRVHYFDYQFLREGDFTEEQEYHRALLRHHNRALHTWGVAHGLELTAVGTDVKVGAGVALDVDGYEIVLTEPKQVSLSELAPDTSGVVSIRFGQRPTDPSDEGGVSDNTRWTEDPIVEVRSEHPTGDDEGRAVVLGRANRTGTSVTGFDLGMRRLAGPAVRQRIEIRDAAGGDDSDPLVIERVRRAVDQNDLRITIGDNLGDRADRLVVGAAPGGAFQERFVVANDGSVWVKGQLHLADPGNVVHVKTVNLTQRNAGRDAPGQWRASFGNEFAARPYTVFAVCRGFTIFGDRDHATGAHMRHDGAIPQNVWVKVVDWSQTEAWGQSYASESEGDWEWDNMVFVTVVAIGSNTSRA